MGKFSLAKTAWAITLLTVAAVPAQADLKRGVDKWSQGDYAGAVSEWRDLAIQGNADAQFNMGQAFKLGRGVPMDLTQAESWYEKAAAQGHLQASDNYGLLLFQKNERAKALPFLQGSAARGEPRAQYVLGTGYFNGDFVQQDWVRAYALMTRASASGLAAAQRNLAQMDQYIPLAQRQEATALAAQMEQDEIRNRTLQTAGLRAPPSTNAVESAELPPSQAAAPAPVAAPAPAATASGPTRPGVSFTLPEATSTPPQPARAPTPPPVAAPPRPAAPVQTARVPAPAPAQTPAAAAPAPRAGNWRIQLGAFGQADRAKSLWTRLEGQVAGLSDLQPYLVNAGAVTRLQAGPFASRAEAEQMCRAVIASGNSCIAKAP